MNVQPVISRAWAGELWSIFRRGFLLAFILAAFLPRCSFASTNDHVILITVDGMAAFYLSDPQAPIPTLRKLAMEGAQAEGLRVSTPAVTWPNHTTLVTGVHPDKHSVLFNGALIRTGAGQPVKIDGERDKGELLAVPTVYDELHRKGYRIANVNWPCTRGATTIDDNFSDVLDQIKYMTPRLRVELIAAGILDDAEDKSFRAKSAASRDQIWTAAAVHLVKNRTPNFLMFHLLITDTIQHLHGSQSPAAYAAFAVADAAIADLMRALSDAGIRDNTTVLITSDHGFERPTKLVHPNVILRKAALQRPSPRWRVHAVSEGGTAFVYLTDPATAKEDRAKVIQLLNGREGIAEIVQPENYAALHLPDPQKNPQMGDLLLVAKPGYAFSGESFDDEEITLVKSSVGSHGYVATNPNMNGVFIAWGRGIKRGVKLGLVDNIDVAPTIAELFGESFSLADGKVIREILANTDKK